MTQSDQDEVKVGNKAGEETSGVDAIFVCPGAAHGAAQSAELSRMPACRRVTWNEGTCVKGESESNGLTIAQYAEAKCLPADYLVSLGVREVNLHGETVLEIPYYGATCTRYRPGTSSTASVNCSVAWATPSR